MLSDFAIGAVLLQNGRPLAFDNFKLTKSESRWHTTDKEMLALTQVVRVCECHEDMALLFGGGELRELHTCHTRHKRRHDTSEGPYWWAMGHQA